jgi:hypothetical protein
MKIWGKNPFIIGIKSWLKNQNQGKINFNHHNKFEFQNGLLYHDGLLYVPSGPT